MEVSHFTAILEPLARLASETEFRCYIEDEPKKTWNTGIFRATVKNIENASNEALCLRACCIMDDLFKSGVVPSANMWGPCDANADASVLLDYLGQAHPRPPQPNLNLDTSFHLSPRRWLDPEFHNSIAPAYALLMLSTNKDICSPNTTAIMVPHMIFAMGRTDSFLHRHVGLRIAHVIRKPLANITGDVRDRLLPALRTATFGNIQNDLITPGDTSPDRFIYPARDLRYLEILFALANADSEYWLLQLRQDSCDHMQRCISISKALLHTLSQNEKDYKELSLRLVLLFARIACTGDCVLSEWNTWFAACPDNQALLAKQAWECVPIPDEAVPLLIAFTNKMLSNLDDANEEDLAKLDMVTVSTALDGISEQLWIVDTHVDVDEMRSTLETLRTRVLDSRDELLRKFGAK
ncbi:hypothetical protein EDB19DRAFT_1366383 [Suillus lakei]|nr:hypothetical protein EDB19DRAFT_1366383 [Suillus lakei]